MSEDLLAKHNQAQIEIVHAATLSGDDQAATPMVASLL